MYTIKNEKLKVEIKQPGAELHSIQTTDGCEYLWQGIPEVWDGQAPNLFPYIARLTNETYVYEEKEYHMKIHGFIKDSDLTVDSATESSVTFRYDSNEKTLVQYPFAFSYFLTYELDGSTLKITNKVENHDEKAMLFGIGGHPGFNVPLEEGLRFEDYVLEFGNPAHPTRVGFTEDCHLNGQDELYALEEERRIPLQHNLFDQDAIVLKNMDRCVTLRSDKGTRAVKVRFPQYTHLGFWHMPHTTAPYVCIEPWSSLPSRYGVVEDLSQQSDLVRLEAGKIYENQWSIEIIE